MMDQYSYKANRHTNQDFEANNNSFQDDMELNFSNDNFYERDDHTAFQNNIINDNFDLNQEKIVDPLSIRKITRANDYTNPNTNGIQEKNIQERQAQEKFVAEKNTPEKKTTEKNMHANNYQQRAVRPQFEEPNSDYQDQDDQVSMQNEYKAPRNLRHRSNINGQDYLYKNPFSDQSFDSRPNNNSPNHLRYTQYPYHNAPQEAPYYYGQYPQTLGASPAMATYPAMGQGSGAAGYTNPAMGSYANPALGSSAMLGSSGMGGSQGPQGQGSMGQGSGSAGGSSAFGQGTIGQGSGLGGANSGGQQNSNTSSNYSYSAKKSSSNNQNEKFIILALLASVVITSIIIGIGWSLFAPKASSSKTASEPTVSQKLDNNATSNDPSKNNDDLVIVYGANNNSKPGENKTPAPSPTPSQNQGQKANPIQNLESSPTHTMETLGAPLGEKPRPQAKTTSTMPISAATISKSISKEQTRTPVSTSEDTQQPKYWIQVFSTTSRDRALQIQKELSTNGMIPTILTKNLNNTTYYRLRVGPYTNKAESNKFLTWIKQNNDYKDAYIALATNS